MSFAFIFLGALTFTFFPFGLPFRKLNFFFLFSDFKRPTGHLTVIKILPLPIHFLISFMPFSCDQNQITRQMSRMAKTFKT